MKQRIQYAVLAIVLPLVFKLPQYRAYAHLADESTESLQARMDRIKELRKLVRFYNDQFMQLSFFGISGLFPGREEEMITKLIQPAHLARTELDRVTVEEDIVGILLAYRQLKATMNH